MFLPLKDENPSSSRPVITYLLIVTNVLVFFYELSIRPYLPAFFQIYGVVPFEYTHLVDVGPPSRIPLNLVTSMFLHGGWMHLIGNMLFLWIFGDNVEDAFGHGRFLIFYLLSGFAAAATQIIFYPNSLAPMIGASGAISGVLGAYFILYPNARVLTLVPDLWTFGLFYRIVPLRAYIFLGLWFVFQILFALLTAGGGGVAWFAHIGGFVAGVLMTPIFLNRKRYAQRYFFDDFTDRYF